VTATIIRGDAAHLPLPDSSVDLIVTSPPYFGLRSYSDGGEHYAGQIGAEPTPAAYIAALLDCTREWVRVLKPSGSLFVNLGDKYSQRVATRPSSHQDGLFPGRPELAKDWKRDRAAGLARMPNQNVTDAATGAYVPEKSLMLLPQRYAIGCVDQVGLILRAEIIWSKPNGLPESVQDRVRRSHEQWFHLVKSPRYYSAVDAIREPHEGPWKSPGSGRPAAAVGPQARNGHSQWERTRDERDATVRHALGKLPGSVWTVATQPLKVPASLGVNHFAAFPMEWPRRLILGWSPPGICTGCGDGRRLVALREIGPDAQGRQGTYHGGDRGRLGHARERKMFDGLAVRTITGYACACDQPTAPTRPAVVLDPFGGTGTTALVADVLGRHGISVDMSADYCRLARWRTTDPRQRDRADGRKPRPVRKPRLQVPGQLTLI
jgi:SAM-dependent methyltransferase